MKAISIDMKLLVQVDEALRIAGRGDLALRLMKQIDLLRVEHIEHLMCAKHAAKLRQNDRSTIHYHVGHGNLRCYKICCRYYVSRRQVAELPRGYQRRLVGIQRNRRLCR